MSGLDLVGHHLAAGCKVGLGGRGPFVRKRKKSECPLSVFPWAW